MSTPDQSPAREPVFNIPGVILAIFALCGAVFLVETYVLTDAQDNNFVLDYAFIPARFSQFGGFYSPAAWLTTITYSFMHGSFTHIAVNMVWLAAFGSPLAARIGPLRTSLFWVVTAIAAVMMHFAIYPASPIPLVGASGAISGMMGAAARFGFRRSTQRNSAAFTGPLLPITVALRTRTVLVFVAVWFITNVATGLFAVVPGEGAATIAWEAHIGGFLIGFLGIALFDRRS